MEPLGLLVVSDPTAKVLRMLEELPENVTITVGDRPEAFAKAGPAAAVMFNRMARKDTLRAVWNLAPNLKWVHSFSAGVNNLMFPEFIESPVPLTNARGVFSRSLAEFAIGAALFFAKDFRRMLRQQQAGVWEEFDVEELHGKTMGIVGYGSIGRAVAEKAKAFGMRVIAVRRRPEAGEGDALADRVLPGSALDELMAESDYVTVAMPLTSESRGFIGEAALRAMKSTGVLINIGRGPTIEEGALIRALQERWIRGAALDVFHREPLPAGHPLYSLENVLLSPHSADHTPQWEQDSMRVFLDNFNRFLRGEPLRNPVDKAKGY
ncbi:MAG: D-2-hydroxyacid dehydrogenase [Bryobacteraceae bacterium]|nr:D-2-hydroxyacid dehydrogenase [Bryobacteraceae bacterium]